MASDNITRNVNIYINDREVTNSLNGIDREMRKVQMQMRNLNGSAEDYDQQLAKLKGEYDQLSTVQKRFRDEISGIGKDINKVNDNIGSIGESTKDAGEGVDGLKSSFSQIFSGVKSGDFGQVQAGLSGIKTGFLSAAKAGWAFIATPVGAALAGITVLALGVKELYDYNEAVTEMNNKLSSLGVPDMDLSSVRSEIKATADTYDKEFDVIAEKANSLSKSYKISMTEANDLIARGLADGGKMNDEYLDSLGEYDQFFAKAGYSAKNFIDLVNTGYENGTFADKLPDAIKEADLALKEATKTTRDALHNAFGASFSEEILEQVSSGEITTKEALERVGKKANEVGLSQQQNAQLTADLFKGAGEDAGGAVEIFAMLEQASNRTMSETAKLNDEYRLSQERLAKINAEALEISGFSDSMLKLKIISVDAWASMVAEMSGFKSKIQPLTNLVGVVLVGAFEGLKLTLKAAWVLVSGVLLMLSNGIEVFAQTCVKLFNGDLKGALQVVIDGFVNLGLIVANVFIGIKNNVIGFIEGMVNSMAPFLKKLGFDIDGIQKKLASWKSEKYELRGEVKVDKITREVTQGAAPEQEKKKGTYQETDADKKAKAKAAEELRKLLEKQAKEREALRKQLLDAQRAAQDAELALMEDGYLKEEKLLNVQYDRKIEDLKAHLFKESELKKMNEDISLARARGNSSEAKRLQNLLAQKLEINKTYNESVVLAEQTRELKIKTLKEKYLEIDFQNKQTAHARDMMNLDTAHNNELNGVKTLEDAKAILSESMSEQELSRVKTLDQAKKLISEKHLKEKFNQEKKFLDDLAQMYMSVLDLNQEAGFTLFSEEEKDKVLKHLEEVKNKISSLKDPAEEPKEPTNAFDSAKKTGIDILGFDAGSWEVLFGGLDTFAEKIQAVQMVAQGLQNAFSSYFSFMEAGETKALAAFQKSVDKKKAEQSKLLERGYIDQEVYNARIAKAEEELNKKKAELEYKQAKRKKAMSVSDAMINTGVAIMQAYAQMGPLAGNIAAAAIGVLGALQVATILKQPLPERGFKVGGYTGDGDPNEVAGQVHKSEYVIPSNVLKDGDPRMPVVMEYLESKRNGRNATLGDLSDNVPGQGQSSAGNSSRSMDALVVQLLKVVQNNTQVMERLLKGDLTAIVELNLQSAKRIRQRIFELENLETKRKI